MEEDSFYGQMVEDMLVIGLMESSRDMVRTIYLINHLNMVYGRMEKELNG